MLDVQLFDPQLTLKALELALKCDQPVVGERLQVDQRCSRATDPSQELIQLQMNGAGVAVLCERLLSSGKATA